MVPAPGTETHVPLPAGDQRSQSADGPAKVPPSRPHSWGHASRHVWTLTARHQLWQRHRARAGPRVALGAGDTVTAAAAHGGQRGGPGYVWGGRERRALGTHVAPGPAAPGDTSRPRPARPWQPVPLTGPRRGHTWASGATRGRAGALVSAPGQALHGDLSPESSGPSRVGVRGPRCR